MAWLHQISNRLSPSLDRKATRSRLQTAMNICPRASRLTLGRRAGLAPAKVAKATRMPTSDSQALEAQALEGYMDAELYARYLNHLGHVSPDILN